MGVDGSTYEQIAAKAYVMGLWEPSSDQHRILLSRTISLLREERPKDATRPSEWKAIKCPLLPLQDWLVTLHDS